MCGFPSIRTTDRRLKILIEAGYLTRKYILYGVPALYFATRKAKEAFNLDFLTTDIRAGHIQHQIATIDTAIYFTKKLNITSIQSEREFKHLAGFQARQHYPDFIYIQNDKTYAVEIELTFKNKDNLKKNININYNAYKGQYWIIPEGKVKIWNVLNQAKKELTDIETLTLEEVESYVKTL